MTNNPNSINSIESDLNSGKSSKFIENTKRAVRNTLVKTGIVASTMTPIATTTTSTVIPASVNTITAITPLASTAIKTISLGTAAGLLAACSKDDPDGPINPEKPTEKDTTPPTIEISKSEIDITGGKQVRIDGNQLYIGDVLVASWSDNKSKNCKITLSLNGKDITSGTTISEEGTLTIKVSDEAGNSKSSDIKLNNEEYKTIEITNIQPVEILPIIGQIESGDKQAYEHIEHLRIAEATRIRDMMRKYGAGNHSAEEYQELMMRLNTGMTMESPQGYTNYEIIGLGDDDDKSSHAHNERHILNSLIQHTNFKIVCTGGEKRENVLGEFVKDNPNSINIFGNSAYGDADSKSDYDKYLNRESIRNLCNSKNFIIFVAGTNIEDPKGTIKNKIYNGEYEADEHGRYSLASLGNSDKNNDNNSHLLVTIATNPEGDIDQTNETVTSSKYPIGFANNILFSGRAFPYLSLQSGKIFAEGENNNRKYSTSYSNYLNVAITDLCFQMFAEVKDVDELLEMIRSTTLTDYIRFNGDTQELQLINPAGFFEKYLMPTDLPTCVKSGENIPLKKGYYKGIIFDIPGAEVKINGKWVAYNNTNKSIIKAENPMNLEWRLNGELYNKMGYKGKGKIIIVDDKWNGLNIDKDYSISVQ